MSVLAGSLCALPDEVLVHIISYLPLSATRTFAQTCKRFYSLASDPYVWKGYGQRCFNQVQPAATKEMVRYFAGLNYRAGFTERRISHNFNSMTLGRGVKYNEFFKNSWHFIYTFPSSRSLSFNFRLKWVPQAGLKLKVTHLTFPYPNTVGFGAFVTILVNDAPLVERFSPQSYNYTQDHFDVPRDLLKKGSNALSWIYHPDATTYYWIQDFVLATNYHFDHQSDLVNRSPSSFDLSSDHNTDCTYHHNQLTCT